MPHHYSVALTGNLDDIPAASHRLSFVEDIGEAVPKPVPNQGPLDFDQPTIEHAGAAPRQSVWSDLPVGTGAPTVTKELSRNPINLPSLWRSSLRLAAAVLLQMAAAIPRAGHHLMSACGVIKPYLLRGCVSRIRKSATSLLIRVDRPSFDLHRYDTARRTKPRLCFLTCLWQRPELSRLVMEYYRHIADRIGDIDLGLVAVGSEGEVSREIVESNGFNYFEHPNTPLSDKWEFGLRRTQALDPDGVVLLGSDDLFCPKVISHYAECLRRRDLFVGYMDSYFLDLESSDLFKWRGYAGPKWRARRITDTIGMGRMLARPLLEKLDFSLWDGIRANRNLDHLAQRSLTRLHMLPVIYEHGTPVRCGSLAYHHGQLGVDLKSVGGCILDIKASPCITPVHRYSEVPGTCQPVEAPWDFLVRYFPSDIVGRLHDMAQSKSLVN
jgi:hypothetical protein